MAHSRDTWAWAFSVATSLVAMSCGAKDGTTSGSAISGASGECCTGGAMTSLCCDAGYACRLSEGFSLPYCELECAAPSVHCGDALARAAQSCVAQPDDGHCGSQCLVCPPNSKCAVPPTGDPTNASCACTDPALPDLCVSGVTAVCRNLKTDPKNCGACGNACFNGACEDGACQTFAFVTKALYPASFAGGENPFTGASAICQKEATAARLPGAYFAWLGTSGYFGNGTPCASIEACARRSPAAILLPDGTTRVANSWSELLDTLVLHHAIDQTSEGGTILSGDDTRRVMTGVDAKGGAPLDGNCNDFVRSYGSLIAGDATSTSGWTQVAAQPPTWDCSLSYRLYCFQIP